MLEALKVFDTEDNELKRAKDEMLLIKVRYFAALANIYYIKGSYEDSKNYIEKAIEICGDEQNYSFETSEDFKKHLKEMQSMKLKCEARILKVSSLDLRPDEVAIENKDIP